MSELVSETEIQINYMQVMLMRLKSKSENPIVPKGTKFTGSGIRLKADFSKSHFQRNHLQSYTQMVISQKVDFVIELKLKVCSLQ